METSKNLFFCASAFWNSNLTWNSNDQDFSKCFHETILVYLPCLFLWISAPFLYKSCQQTEPKSELPWTLIMCFRFLLQGSLWVLCLVDLGIKLASPVFEDAAGLVASGILALTLALSLVLSYKLKLSGLPTSGFLFGFWSLLLLCQAGLSNVKNNYTIKTFFTSKNFCQP